MKKPEFDYAEVDLEGEQNLKVIAEADAFNSWMAETVAPYCQGKVIEVGSGIGNISRWFLEAGHKLMLSDIRPQYCQHLHKHFGGYSNLLGVEQLDLVHPNFEQEYADLLSSFNSLYSLNVVEHIQNDTLALRNAAKLLAPGGTMVILVPAFQQLYNGFDTALGHYRRYTRKSLTAAFASAGLQTQKSFYFNAPGTAGWYVSGKLQKNETIPQGQMKLYNALVPLFKITDVITRPFFGLSVIGVATLR
jgi:2-polyprenyl-3-methyl-5-hydroxy-6-metoxy-1,4-benzoquinol methylase